MSVCKKNTLISLTLDCEPKGIELATVLGTLQLFNLVSGVVSSPIAANSPSAKGMAYIEALRYNSFQASMVAGACESGHVGIWDANGNRFVHAFSDHKGPATGIVFSPVNAALMASTALDKKCILYDSQVRNHHQGCCLDWLSSQDFET